MKMSQIRKRVAVTLHMAAKPAQSCWQTCNGLPDPPDSGRSWLETRMLGPLPPESAAGMTLLIVSLAICSASRALCQISFGGARDVSRFSVDIKPDKSCSCLCDTDFSCAASRHYSRSCQAAVHTSGIGQVAGPNMNRPSLITVAFCLPSPQFV